MTYLTSGCTSSSSAVAMLLALLAIVFRLAACETPLSMHGGISRTVAAAAAETNSKTYTLFYDLDGSGNFTPRSLITVSSSDNGLASMASNSAASNSNEGSVSITIENVGEKCINITSFGTGLCKLKLVDDMGHEAISAASFCSMRRSLNLVKQQFREKIEIMVTSTGDLLSFSVTPLISPLAPPCGELFKQPLSKGDEDVCFTFKTQVTVEGAITATSVPLVLPASRPPPGRLSRNVSFVSMNSTVLFHLALNRLFYVSPNFAGLLFFPTAKLGVNGDPSQPEGQQQQHKSFLVRYWYIILPIFIMTCLTGGEEPPPPPSSSGARTSNTATATSSGNVARAAAPLPQTTAGTVKRRGKRD
jgi:hypothetical protein